uniref:Uncharacterized protein n=1 Tax=Cannabis sativa TaxID=3483 RepID=A0A803NIF4_CANSA
MSICVRRSGKEGQAFRGGVEGDSQLEWGMRKRGQGNKQPRSISCCFRQKSVKAAAIAALVYMIWRARNDMLLEFG